MICFFVKGMNSGTSYRYWFCFSVRGFSHIDDIITITIKNSAYHHHFISAGAKPMFRIGHYGAWERIPVQMTLLETSQNSVRFTVSASALLAVLNKRFFFFFFFFLSYLFYNIDFVGQTHYYFHTTP
jgi:hypothetical protein